jgi:malate dehydrogenase (oxaloacetate-decarboxylating)(NADP+)
VRRFGLTPKVALVSHSNFGSSDAPTAVKMREARESIRSAHARARGRGRDAGDAALSEEIRNNNFPEFQLKGEANLLVMPGIDAGQHLLQPAEGRRRRRDHHRPDPARRLAAVHILTPSATVRRIVNMTALAVVDAQQDRKQIAMPF